NASRMIAPCGSSRRAISSASTTRSTKVVLNGGSVAEASIVATALSVALRSRCRAAHASAILSLVMPISQPANPPDSRRYLALPCQAAMKTCWVTSAASSLLPSARSATVWTRAPYRRYARARVSSPPTPNVASSSRSAVRSSSNWSAAIGGSCRHRGDDDVVSVASASTVELAVAGDEKETLAPVAGEELGQGELGLGEASHVFDCISGVLAGLGADDNLISDLRISEPGQLPDPVRSRVDMPGQDDRSLPVANGRAVAVPAHQVRIGRELHLPVVSHADRHNIGVDADRVELDGNRQVARLHGLERRWRACHGGSRRPRLLLGAVVAGALR